MPNATDTFAQIAPSNQQRGPFSAYLNPLQQPTPSSIPEPTGWEAHPHAVAGADIALGFLKGIRQNRVAQAAQQEQNSQASLDNYRAQVNAQLQNPDLTEAGRAAILSQANATMAQHTQYELRDAPKDGIGGFFKNLLIHATGGPIKTREPIDFDSETGKLTKAVSATDPTTGLSYSQSKNYQDAVQEAQQAVNQLKQSNPYPTQQDVQQAVANSFKKVQLGAPSRLNDFAQVIGVPMGSSYPVAWSAEAGMQQLSRPMPSAQVPPTQPPPAPPPELSPVRPMATAAPPPGAGTPQATAAPPGGIEYEPGYDRQRFAALTGIAGRQGSPVQVSQPHLVTSGGTRLMGTMVMGSPNPQDNGYWDAQTGQKIKSPVAAVSLTPGSHVPRRGVDNWAIVYDPNLGRETYDLGPDGKPYKIPENFVQVTDNVGNVRWAPKSEAAGQVTGSQGIETRKDAASAGRQQTGIAASAGRQGTGLAAGRASKLAEINLSFDRRVDALKRSARGAVTATALPGHPPTPQALAQAEQSVQADIAQVEQERAQALADFNASTPAVTAPPPGAATPKHRTTPPPSAPPAAKPVTPAAAPAAAKKPVSFGDLPDK